MAPRKGVRTSVPPPQPSDYETDAAPPAVDVPLPAPRSNEELNFFVLRRIYPDLQAIEHVTPYAALYNFSLATQGWEKVGIEGTLFLCQLTPSSVGADRYAVVILNRRGLDNFYLELTSPDDTEVSDPYVILQGDQVYGIWIFADPPPSSTSNCRVETAKKIMEAAENAHASREAVTKKAQNGSSQSQVQAVAADSVPMGRQLSLRELFGQQREQEAAINTAPVANVYPQQGLVPTPSSAATQQDVLGQLFMKAKQDFNGVR